MSERDIFTAAREMTDPVARSAYLDGACGGDNGLRMRVEALLRAHDQPDSLLDHPAVAAPGPASQTTVANGYEGDAATHDEVPLGFLAPATRPDSRGRIGHYEVLQVLGHGGFGIVFRAFDDVLHRVVAVKVLSPQIAATSPARKRFLREARSSAQVRHENVVQVHEVGEQPLPYLVMEFIPGETLQQKLDRTGPLDVPEVLRIGRQIAAGLAEAHDHDLIHRDIKPSNVLLESGPRGHAKITDFGLARAADDASISQSGIIAGTPMYMAPEQAEGQTLDQRADLFSLGSVLYQMVAGRPPFRATTAVAVLKRVAEDRPRAIREIIPETPQWLCDIIAKLHAKDPDDRYQSAREVADVLADCEAQLKANARLKDYSRIPRSNQRRSGRRNWAAAAVALLVLPLIALSATGLTDLTRLFPKKPLVSVGNPPPNPAPGPDDSESEGWVQLFNGKDLTGWKKDPRFPGFWRVDENGILIGAGPIEQDAFLDTERDNFEDFHLRVEAQVDTPKSDSGVFFRVPLLPSSYQPPDFDEINIGFDPTRPSQQTGSLLIQKGSKATWLAAATGLAKPKEWFVLEIIARGDRVVTKVNGKAALETRTTSGNHRGHILLQQYGPETTVRFKKIEIKELPPATARTESAAEDKAALDARLAQEASAKHLNIPVETTNSIGVKLRLIPAGKFTMGSSQEEIDRCLLKVPDGAWPKKNLPTEGPEHPVEITQPFYLGATEVTVGQFRRFVDEEGYPVGNARWRNPGFDQTDQHPVVWVSWNNAVDFCKWLSKKEGKEYRLPTEAEWEYSCRAGKAWSRYCFGDDDAELENYAWLIKNSRGGTHPAGQKKPNAWGLYDMHGNAWEWCQDNYDPDYYKNSPVKDPPGGNGGSRVSRGGSWAFFPLLCRSAFRGYLGPDDHRDSAGFRVLLVSAAAGVGTESGTNNKPVSTAIAPFTDADVQRIAALPAAYQIEEVRRELKRRNPGFDGKMETIIEGGVVTEFQIVTDQVTDIAPIRVFNSLRVLDLGGTHTNYHVNGQLADLSPLKGMNLTELTKLNLSLTKVGDVGLVHFKDCTNLTYLGLAGTRVSDKGLAYFKKCKSLTSLGLYFIPASDAGLAYFKDCKGLTHLGLSGTKVSDAGLANFKDCNNLTTLSLDRTQVGDAGMVHFQDCKSLTDLNLAGTKVSDVGLAHFKDCKNLNKLHMHDTQVGDAGLAQLKGTPLRVLWISNTGIADLTPLQGMPLENIWLTPKNITKGLDILRDMKSLKTIGIAGTQAGTQTWPAAEFWKRYDKGEFKK